MAVIKNLVFDLDGTLYPANKAVEKNVDDKSVAFFCRYFSLLPAEAEKMIAGFRADGEYEAEILEKKFNISKAEYIDEVCNVDVSMLEPDPELASLLAALPQRKFIFTDSIYRHVVDVLKQIEVPVELFDGIFDAPRTGCHFKYSQRAFQVFAELAGIKPEETVMFEDNAVNLQNAARFGFQTVFISPGGETDAAAGHSFADIGKALKYIRSLS